MQFKPPALTYRLLSTALLPFWLVHAFIHSFKTHNFKYFWQRLGIHQIDRTPKLWIHASSVGEVEVIKPIVNQLTQDHKILVTTFTATGYQHALTSMYDEAEIAVIPIDWWLISRHFIRSQKIKLALIAETELWPEILYQYKVTEKPLLQINARLTTKTLHQRAWMRRILENTLTYFDHVLTRNEQDVRDFYSMGVAHNNIHLCGNLKFIQTEGADDYPRLIDRPYLLFASTHEPEEFLFAQMAKSLQLSQLVVIAPRHPTRATQIMSTLKPLNLNMSQRSKHENITDKTQIYLADTLGELKALLAHAEIVIMGGSFADCGGHNVLEPANLGAVIITGPSDQDIAAEVALLLEKDAIIQVNDSNELKQTIQDLMSKKSRMRQLSSNARTVVREQRHVLDRYLNIIQGYLS